MCVCAGRKKTWRMEGEGVRGGSMGPTKAGKEADRVGVFRQAGRQVGIETVRDRHGDKDEATHRGVRGG